MNLESLGVVELTLEEQINTEGGDLCAELAGAALVSLITLDIDSALFYFDVWSSLCT